MRHCSRRRGDRSHKSIGKKVQYFIKEPRSKRDEN